MPIFLGKLTTVLKQQKGSVREKAVSDCYVFLLKVQEQLISTYSNFEDKVPNLHFAEISKLKWRPDDGVVNSLSVIL